MNIYENKSKVKIVILITALLIGGASLFYTNIIVEQLSDRERRTIELYANALKYSINSEVNDELSFLNQEIISANNSIPVILTDADHLPLNYRNLDINEDISKKRLEEILRKEIEIMAEQHDPIEVNIGEGPINYIYYKNSYLLTQLTYYPYIQLTRDVRFFRVYGF